MRLLVLGGTRFVGRAVVAAALGRGDEVTTYNRGSTGVPAGVQTLYGDRTDPGQLAQLRGLQFDAVIDTWARAPRVVRDSARLLADSVGYYGYVSSCSVYRWPIPIGADESTPVVDAAADADTTDYAADKRGGELAVEEHFAGRSLCARAGLILGPHEDIGRLPWWLRRLAAGGRTLAPGPPDRPVQYVDARDLAGWLLRCADAGTSGAFNAVSAPGHATMRELLEVARDVTGSAAELSWVDPEVVLSAGVEPWSQLPIWVPPTGELAGLYGIDTHRALAAGLRCRPVAETVVDTWDWLRDIDGTGVRPGLPAPGIDADTEARVFAAAEAGPAA